MPLESTATPTTGVGNRNLVDIAPLQLSEKEIGRSSLFLSETLATSGPEIAGSFCNGSSIGSTFEER